ncbi:MAG: hypothetical protein JXK92_01710 [Erysipelotrichaceae bacterium]|nr:hypothetical protein [Erysipelotrichaceae bacterium]
MDDLLFSARQFESMFDIEYRFKVGRKKKIKEIMLRFSKTQFHHLVGLHKLSDLDYFMKASKSKIFNEIISAQTTIQHAQVSRHYYEIKDRIHRFGYVITEIFEKTEFIYIFDGSKCKGSKIKADFVIKYVSNDGLISFMFLNRCDSEQNDYTCTSFFIYENRDYTFNQEQYKFIKIVKIRQSSGETSVLLDRYKMDRQ